MNIYPEIKNFEKELIDIRRSIHKNPEVAFEEVKTAKLVEDFLSNLNIKTITGLAKTGVVGILEGNKNTSNKAIALRADMDALHIEEGNNFSHKSCVEGKMHACGHDGHTAMLLGAAKYLAENKDFDGKVYFIFQPAEEGLGGAKVMLDEGLLDKCNFSEAYGLHNYPGYAENEFFIKEGYMMASSDTWEVTFSGTGGHGGAITPDLVDPTIPAANFITALQTIVSRNVHPDETAVISIGSISGGDAESPNIIPASIKITGTSRAFLPEVRDMSEDRLIKIATDIATAYRCKADFNYNRRYSALFNHKNETEYARLAAADTVGKNGVGVATPSTGAEDFAFILEKVPGSYIFLGAGDRDKIHTPGYDFNDNLLVTGASYWVNLVKQRLPIK